MNHIVPAQPPRREPPETVLIGQDHRTLVLGGVGRGAFDPAHHQLAVLDGEAHASLDQIERGAAEHLEARSEEHTSELQSLMRNSYAVFCLKKKIQSTNNTK